MTYVMSNLHGKYSAFCRMLSEISFKKDDVMFILGDIVDYGDESMELVCDLSVRENIWVISGEHDARAAELLGSFSRMLKNGTSPDPEYIKKMTAWVADGGQQTLDSFLKLDEDMKEGAVEFLSELEPYDTVEVGGEEYLLVHSGVCGYKKGRALEDYEPEAFWGDEPERSIEGVTVICGHVPTTEAFGRDGAIYRGEGYIAIDCGAARGGKLGCLCLETGKMTYTE